MKTYLVTGGAGFIGSFLVEKLLENGHKVLVIDNFDPFYSYETKILNLYQSGALLSLPTISGNREKDLNALHKSEFHTYFQLFIKDFSHQENIQDIFENHSIDGMIHLAALAGVRPSIERPLDYERVNVKGTLNLLELCHQFNIKNAIIASSSSVYGNNKVLPFSEEDRVDHPISPYASTKKAAEVMSYVYHDLYDMNIVQLRFFTVYGPRQRPDLAIHKFTNLIMNEEPIPFYGDGSTARDYTYIEDIIQGVISSIELVENAEKKIYEIINLGESEIITLNEMVQTLEKHLGKKAIVDKQPMQAGDVQKTYANISKAKELLGYRPSTSFDEGIQKFVTWYRAQHEN